MTRTKSHYDWLNEELPNFLANVSKHEKGCEHFKDIPVGPLLSAHGDKVSQYEPQWDKAGIPFWQGAAIFLLSYFGPIGDESRQTVKGWVAPHKWVIDNYERFKPHFQTAQ